MPESNFVPFVILHRFAQPERRRIVTVRCELTREDYAQWITDVAFDYHISLDEARRYVARHVYYRARFEAYRRTPVE